MLRVRWQTGMGGAGMMGGVHLPCPTHGGALVGRVRCYGGTEATTATFLAFPTCCSWSPGGAGHLPGLSGHVPVKRALLGLLGRGPWCCQGGVRLRTWGPLERSLSPCTTPSLPPYLPCCSPHVQVHSRREDNRECGGWGRWEGLRECASSCGSLWV